MAELAGSFEQYGAWRDALAQVIVQLRRWLQENKLLDADAARRIGAAIDRLAEDKLVVAVVAEFSRGKSELINAIFFADCGRRILPTSAGRTTMCPTELMYDDSLPPCIRALPIESIVHNSMFILQHEYNHSRLVRQGGFCKTYFTCA